MSKEASDVSSCDEDISSDEISDKEEGIGVRPISLLQRLRNEKRLKRRNRKKIKKNKMKSLKNKEKLC